MAKERIITEIHNYSHRWKTRVAIYCRVSTVHVEQALSLANQISHFKEMVGMHIDWELVDTYADVQSGKNTAGRPEFQRMLEDCRNCKIDFIVTKSISRFGRNTADTLAAINELHEKIIAIFFETENINTRETSKNFLMTVMEAAAQAESETRSQNIKWGITRGLETGTSKLYSRKCYGYRHDDEGNLVIDEPEAKIVRSIFDLYLSGYSIVGIVKELERRGVKSPTGKARWSKRTIETMLSNEKYIGNVLIGKIYCKEYPNNKRLPNRGEREKYFSTGGHPAIIAVEQFECVMAEKTNRRNVQTDEYGTMTRRVYHYSMKTVDIIDE